MKKAILNLVFICIFISISFFGENRAKIYLGTPTRNPISTVNGNGILDKFVKLAFKKIGYKCTIRFLPPERSLLLANSGHIGGDLTRIKGINKFYKNLRIIPVKLLDFELGAFSKKYNFRLRGWRSLRKYHIGYIIGNKFVEKAIKKFRHKVGARNLNILFGLLNDKKIDFVVCSKLMGLKILKRKKLKKINLLLPLLQTIGLYMYLNKKYRYLIPKLTKVLNRMKRKGIYYRMVSLKFKKFENEALSGHY